MTKNHARLGTDLRLLDDLEQRTSRDHGNDLVTARRATTGHTDLALLDGAQNLQQALLLRLLTARGELAPLGHPSYGSRLGELIGESNTEATRDRAKLYVLETLAAEPRIAEVLSAEVRARSRRSRDDSIDIAVELRAIDGDTVLNLVFPFFLEGGQR